MGEKEELYKCLTVLELRLRELYYMHSGGLMSKFSFETQQTYILKKRKELKAELKSMAKCKDDSEVEMVKNILTDVLKTSLRATQDNTRDAYAVNLKFIIPRDLIVQGSVDPCVQHLLKIKYGLIVFIDEAINEINNRNRGLI